MRDHQYRAVMDELAALRKEVSEIKPAVEWLQLVYRGYMDMLTDTRALRDRVELIFGQTTITDARLVVLSDNLGRLLAAQHLEAVAENPPQGTPPEPTLQ